MLGAYVFMHVCMLDVLMQEHVLLQGIICYLCMCVCMYVCLMCLCESSLDAELHCCKGLYARCVCVYACMYVCMYDVLMQGIVR